jgi:16S rRNA G527 N7-methylase RsmG
MHCVVDTSRIAELLHPFLSSPLTALQLDQISTYIDLLLRWNARVNLTAVRAPQDIVTRHFGESLFAAGHLLPSGADAPIRDTPQQTTKRSVPQVGVRSLDANLSSSTTEAARETDPAAIGPAHGGRTSSVPSHLVDIGSGAGFPGLPMKIWSPQTRVTLIESNHKKVAFLREVIRALTLTDIDVFPARALLAPTARMALLTTRPQFPLAQSLTPALHWLPPLSIPLSENRLLAIGVR